jgi:RNA polymerase sigma-70 factor (ECF subfamily)
LIDAIYRNESGRVLATLIRTLGDFDLAEEALHEAFAAAVEQWEREGVPANPRAWLVSTGRFKAIDVLRRRDRFDNSLMEIAKRARRNSASSSRDGDEIEDDRLRLMFTCCHPAIAANVQIALTLREVCGLTTDEIASAFLTAPATIAQRIVRGKAKIRDAGIPYVIPTATDLTERLDSVLAVIYLVFTEGYSATSGESMTRQELSEEAIRLGRLLMELLPDPEVIGLLALMLLQESRRSARVTTDGDLILLEDQDRTLWNRDQIREGQSFVERALATRRFGAYTMQAAIAAVHANATTANETDWRQITTLYDSLHSLNPSPVIELNRAVAVAMGDSPEAGLSLIDSILERRELTDYHLLHAARADLLRRLGKNDDARVAYKLALSLAKQEPERRFLLIRLKEL